MTQTTNQVIPVPQRDEKGKVIGEFYPFQRPELVALKQIGIINNTTFIHLALRLENPFLDKPIRISPKKLAKRWDIPEASVYKAIAKLKELGVISIEQGEVVIKFNTPPCNTDTTKNTTQENSLGESIIKNDNSLSDPIIDYQNGESIIKNDNSLSDPIIDYQNRESDIYIDHARGQTIQTNTDFNQTVTDSDARTHAVNMETSDNSQGNVGKYLYQQEGEDSDIKSFVEIVESNPISEQNQDSGIDQGSGACSTSHDKASDKSNMSCDNNTDKEMAIATQPEKENGDRRLNPLEKPKPKPNAPKPSHVQADEYENREEKSLERIIPMWDQMPPEQHDTIKRIHSLVKNPYQQPWKRSAVNFTKTVIEACRSANKFYSKRENHGSEVGRLKNLDKAVKRYQHDPVAAIAAYQELMSYVERFQEEPTGTEELIDRDALLAKFRENVGR